MKIIRNLKNKVNDYEVIKNLPEYIEKNYKGAEVLTSVSLKLDNFTQTDFKNQRNNCTLTSILRVLMYNIDKFQVLPESKEVLYEDIYKSGKKYFFNEAFGTMPIMISNIVKDVFKEYKVKGKVKGHYLGNFYRPIKSELDNRRPLIMNIVFGAYKKHSITISGYIILNYRGMKIKILEVVDNWSSQKRFLDYTRFSHSINSFNTFSLNTIEIN